MVKVDMGGGKVGVEEQLEWCISIDLPDRVKNATGGRRRTHNTYD